MAKMDNRIGISVMFPSTKMFGGQRYYRYTATDRKEYANMHIQELIKKGYNAKITKGRPLGYPFLIYGIYANPKPPFGASIYLRKRKK